MHFVTGGNFNGKRAWVKQEYPKAIWISAYESEDLRKQAQEIRNNIIVLEGLEYWVKGLAQEIGFPRVREYIKETMESWHDWEKADSAHKVVVIGTDITKGVVPIEKEKRDWRDITGWVYQDIAERAMKVDIIWYGLNHTVKDEEK